MWSSRDIGCKNREFELSLFAKRVILYPGEASGEPLENSKTRHFDWTSVSFFSVDISVFGGEKAKSIVTEPTYIIYESSIARWDRGGENLFVDTKDVQKLLGVGDSAVRLLITLGARSAW